MIVAVKYCGGCNPRFDRARIVTMIARDFPGVRIVYSAPEALAAALLLIICGCSSQCVAVETKTAKFVLSEKEQYAALHKQLQMMEGVSK